MSTVAEAGAYVASAPSIPELVARAVQEYGEDVFLRFLDKDDGVVEKTFAQVGEVVSGMVEWLRGVVDVGDFVGMGIQNSPAWILWDLALSYLRACPVGLHPGWPESEVVGIMQEMEVKVVVVEEGGGLRRILREREGELESVKVVVVLPDLDAGGVLREWPLGGAVDGELAGKEVVGVVGRGGGRLEGGGSGSSASDEKVYTLMFTSGTSGRPRGVILSEKRWLVDAKSSPKWCGGGERGVVLSHMPLSHGADRGQVWQALCKGAMVCVAGRSESMGDWVRQVGLLRPTIILALSHHWSALRHHHSLTAPHSPSPALSSFSLRQQLGGKLEFVVTGGGGTDEKTMKFLHTLFAASSAGEVQASRVRDAYGMTELPGISVDGVIAPDIDLELRPWGEYHPNDKPHARGEIWARRKGLQPPRYFKDEESSRDLCPGDGKWVRTGDVGMLLENDLAHLQQDPRERGTLRIIDRAKHLIELYYKGRSVWIHAATLEQKFKPLLPPQVKEILIVGDRNQSAPILLASAPLSPPTPSPSPSSLLTAISSHSHTLHLHPYERPCGVVVVEEEWSAENGMKTSTGKLRRGLLARKYADKVFAVYAELEVRGEADKEEEEVEEEEVEEEGVEEEGGEGEGGEGGGEGGGEVEESKPSKSEWVKQDVEGIEDWLEYRVKAETKEAEEEIEAVLERAREVVREVREKKERVWDVEVREVKERGEEAEKKALEEGWERLRKRVEHIEEVVGKEGGEVVEELEELKKELDGMRYNIRQARLILDRSLVDGKAKEHAKKIEVYDVAMEEATLLAQSHRVPLPFQIRFHAWFKAPRARGDEGDDEAGAEVDEGLMSEQVLGEAKVFCELTAECIEKDVPDSGRERWLCLDPDVEGEEDCPSADVAHSDEAHAMILHLRRLLAPFPDVIHFLNTKIDPCTSPLPDGTERIWVKATMSDWGLSEEVRSHGEGRREGGLMEDETPSTLMQRALRLYKHRPALGVPSTRPSPFLTAASLSPISSSGFQFATYAHLHTLTSSLVTFFTSPLPPPLPPITLEPGDRIAISARNSIEWSVIDFAAAFCSLVPIGLHSTSTDKDAAHVLAHSKAKLVFIDSSIHWTPATTLSTLPHPPPIVHIDTPTPPSLLSFLHTRKEEGKGGSGEGGGSEDVGAKKDTSSTLNSLFTLLYTSGSSGQPKAVGVRARSFASEMAPRLHALPLVTPSFIPLSHSSDRVRVWQFLANGGRVAFCDYDPRNWAEHEKAGGKKEGMLRVGVGIGEYGVRGLFQQIKRLRPTAVAAPPRIWSGLFTAARKDGDGEVRSWFGTRCRDVITGGGPIAPVVHNWGQSLLPKARFANVYGTTETGAITRNGIPVSFPKLGPGLRSNVILVPIHTKRGEEEKSAGGGGEGESSSPLSTPTSPSTGHLLTRSPLFSLDFPIYFENEEASAKAVVEVDGEKWYGTGDVAERVREHRFELLGRVSEAASTKSGEVVFPAALEAKIEGLPNVDHAFVSVRGDSDTIVLLLVPSASSDAAIDTSSFPFLTPHILHPGIWSPQTGQLNGELKKKRKIIEEEQKEILDELHY